MAWYWWSVVLFLIGVIEYALAEYENLVSVRLKIAQALCFAEINRLLDGCVYFITFSLIWKGIEEGHLTFGAVFPYIMYVQGCVLGSALALIYFKKNKKRTEREKRMQLLEKANRIKKQLRDVRDEIELEVATEMEFEEPIDQESKDAGKEIRNQAENKRESSKKEDSKETPPPQA